MVENGSQMVDSLAGTERKTYVEQRGLTVQSANNIPSRNYERIYAACHLRLYVDADAIFGVVDFPLGHQIAIDLLEVVHGPPQLGSAIV
jgi:hypothetical protein